MSVNIGGTARAMCCRGAVGGATIVDNGLTDYYRSRDALPESPREAVPAILDQLALFDHAGFQKSFVRALGESEREASLLLEGITYAATIWLNEQHVGKLRIDGGHFYQLCDPARPGALGRFTDQAVGYPGRGRGDRLSRLPL